MFSSLEMLSRGPKTTVGNETVCHRHTASAGTVSSYQERISAVSALSAVKYPLARRNPRPQRSSILRLVADPGTVPWTPAPVLSNYYKGMLCLKP